MNEEEDMKAYEAFGGLLQNDAGRFVQRQQEPQILQMLPVEPPPTAPAGQPLPLSGPAGVGDFPDALADTNVQLLEAILQELRSLNQNLRNSL